MLEIVKEIGLLSGIIIGTMLLVPIFGKLVVWWWKLMGFWD